jgi:chromosome segregation ATPase
MKEGSFSGGLSRDLDGFDFADDVAVDVNIDVPLPDQVPARSTARPRSRSGAVETLIQQNDDLMSRLTVALRRISDLEEELEDQSTQTENFKAERSQMRDQVLVLNEKIRLLSARQDEDGTSVEKLKEQAQMYKLRYSQLLQSSQSKESHLQQTVHQVEQRAARLDRFRSRVKRAVAGLKRDLKLKRDENENLLHQVTVAEATLQDVRSNLIQTTDFLKAQTQTQAVEMQGLIERHHADLQAKDDQYRLRATDFENCLIAKDRQFEDHRLETAAEISDLQLAVTRARTDAKDLSLTLEREREEFSTQKAQCESLTEERRRLTEQVENLQALWRDQTARIEKLQTQNQSLQRLNQELSLHINSYRKELRESRE